MEEKKQIFIVEDDPELSVMLTTYFHSQAYDVRSAAYGEEAVRNILEVVPDLVLLDIRLDDIDGYEVCRRLRSNRRTQNVPVIFLTERREKNYKLAGLELGAVDYVTKPFDIGELRLRVRNVLRRNNRESMQNAITGLPEGAPVQERLDSLLGRSDWNVLAVNVRGIDKFRDMYGFIAADDVTRAISLMITNAMQDLGVDDQFIGHIGASDFIIITTPAQCPRLSERCRARLEPSVQYFYPAIDRYRLNQLPAGDRLAIHINCLAPHHQDLDSLENLQNALFKLFE